MYFFCLVSYFEESLTRCYFANCEFIFLETSWNTSYFNCCCFELAIWGRANVQWGSCCSSSFCSFKVRGNILYLLWVAWRTLGLLDGIPRVLGNKPTPLMALWDTGMPGSTMGTPGSTPGMLGSAGHHIPIYTKSLGLHAASHYQWQLNDLKKNLLWSELMSFIMILWIDITRKLWPVVWECAWWVAFIWCNHPKQYEQQQMLASS